MGLRHIGMAFLLAAVFTTPAAAATGNVLLRVQDARTHHPIHATIHLDGPESPVLETDDLGYIRRPLAAGDYRVTISAPGYSVRKTHFNVSPARDLKFHIMLDSENLPEEERPDVVNTRIRPGFTLFHGYVVDAASGQPLPGVTISFTGARVEATTDAKGHYWLSVVTPPELPTGRPGRDTLTYEKQGYETIIYEDVNIFGDETGPGEALEMEKGTGIDRRDGRNKLERQAETGKEEVQEVEARRGGISPELYGWLGTSGTPLPTGVQPNAAQTVTVPGTGGSSTRSYQPCSSKHTCTNAYNYSLEYYVTNGLSGECANYRRFL